MSNEQLFDRYLERTLTEEESGLLLARLEADAEFRKAFLAHVTDIALMINAGSRLELADRASSRSLGMGRAKRPALRWRLVSIPLVLAASLTIVAGLWWLAPDPAMGLRVAEVAGEVNVQHSTVNSQQPNGGRNGSRAVVGQELRLGDRVVVPEGGKAVLKYEGEETTLALHSGVATFGAAAGSKRVKMESGFLICTVAPQKSPFLLETPHGVAEVVGTHFSLGVNAVQTTLAVQEGQVALRQKDRKLEVRAGDTAVGDAQGLRQLSPEDAWLRELLIQAETGPWDVLQMGTGVYSNDVWRMDARNGPAERRIWNMPMNPGDASMVSFVPGQRWQRGVMCGRIMFLPEGASPEIEGTVATTNAAWRINRFRMSADELNVRQASVGFYYTWKGSERGTLCNILDFSRNEVGVWHRYILYFDFKTESPGYQYAIGAVWPETFGILPQDADWRMSADNSTADDRIDVRFVAKGGSIMAQGVKFVPLGTNFQPPPKSLLAGKK